MEISYDPKLNVGYIKLADQSGEVDTLKISGELNIDLSSDGKLYGIELLNAREQLKSGKNNIGFLLKNLETGDSKELTL